MRFRSATVRLTASYLFIIMALSGIFSLILYNVSMRELKTSLHRQGPLFQQLRDIGLFGQSFQEFEARQLAQAKRQLRLNLGLINLIILVAGGGTSYALARRNLAPIEAALQAQTRFTGDASHELRTPLTVMKSEIEVALRDTSLTLDDARDLLESNLEEIGRLEALSNGLLRLAQYERPDTVKTEPVSLARVAADAIERTGKVAASRSIRISNEVESLLVRGDREHLAEAVAVVLDNAVKYSPEHSRVTITSRRSGSTAILEVADEGPGIPAEALPHVFERFYRADNARTRGRQGGYGLGLSIAQHIVERNGGTITAANAKLIGAIFTLRLPIA